MARNGRVTGQANELYDAQMKRVARDLDGTATYYVLDGEKIARVEQPDAGTRDFYVQEGQSICSPLVSVHDQAADAQYWYLFDALGSTMGLTDANGNLSGKLQYDAFGNVLAEENVPRSAFFKYVDAYQYMPESFEDMYIGPGLPWLLWGWLPWHPWVPDELISTPWSPDSGGGWYDPFVGGRPSKPPSVIPPVRPSPPGGAPPPKRPRHRKRRGPTPWPGRPSQPPATPARPPAHGIGDWTAPGVDVEREIEYLECMEDARGRLTLCLAKAAADPFNYFPLPKWLAAVGAGLLGGGVPM